ncbi:MAG: ATP-dependent RecD-like DNA helicase [Oscillospiraceae bacterium]|nr:ATP-dependent RecD-like DNA helicase [Oscillospiraceae bacterium]
MDRGDAVRENQDTTEITGAVTAVIYQSQESGYTVLRLDVGGGEPVTAVGTLPFAAPGETLTLTGTWSTHPSYGDQFKVQWATRTLPTTENAIYDYLASGAVRGVGPATAQAIVDRFGADSLAVMEEHPEQLAALKGITIRKAREIGAAVRRQAALRLLIEFLTRHGLSPALSIKLYQGFGDNALEAVRDDPYLLADSFFGGDFHVADQLALQMGVDGDSPRRLMAATRFTLEHNLQNGHCFIPRDKLTGATARLLEVPRDLAEDALDELTGQGRIISDTLRGIAVCYLDHLYEAEVAVAAKSQALADEVAEGQADIASLIRQVEADTGITYAPEQRQAVEAAALGHLLVITGAPGTGKTTAVRGILGLFDRLGLKTLLAAPTGRAAKRMSELTGRDAFTIHRLLGAGYSGEDDALCFERDESNPLEADAVILDETSMVDILLAQALFRALPPNCRLVLVGDADQLPSVGPGNVFSDLIRSGTVPVVRLTEIFRQAKDSGIVQNAHKINRGEQMDLMKKEADFFFLQRSGAAKTVETVTDLVARRLPENMSIPAQEIQVLSPFKRGEAGTINLNRRLQEALNPPSAQKSERKFGDFVLRCGDKVMQIRNNYDILWKSPDGGVGQGIFNGDIGHILAIDPKADTLTADFDGREVVYTADQVSELELAYAMTVHKSQGSEYRAVIFVAERGPSMLLARKILYTGITRAKELLILVGDGKIVETMTANDRQQKRYSGLKLRLAGE